MVHTQGGLSPPQESCYFRGVRGLAPASSEASRSRGRFVGPHTRRCIHKVVHTKGGLWPPQESCNLRGVHGLAPALREASCLLSKAKGTTGGGEGGEGRGGVWMVRGGEGRGVFEGGVGGG